MARYNLNTNEASILTSWLFEQQGYLDSAVNNLGVSARQARLASPTLDITTWIRTNVKGAFTDQSNWDECAMIWWMRANDNVNLNVNQLPPEKAAWISKIQQWDQSIVDAFVRVSQQARDGNTVTITAENGTTTQRPAGQQLVQQRSLFSKVLPVLQQ
jgi:hypothetical protein